MSSHFICFQLAFQFILKYPFIYLQITRQTFLLSIYAFLVVFGCLSFVIDNGFFYYRPPVGGRFYDMKVVSGYVFLRTYYRYVQKKITANHAAARDARLRSRNSTVSVKAETAECLVARDFIVEQNRDFSCTF